MAVMAALAHLERDTVRDLWIPATDRHSLENKCPDEAFMDSLAYFVAQQTKLRTLMFSCENLLHSIPWLGRILIPLSGSLRGLFLSTSAKEASVDRTAAREALFAAIAFLRELRTLRIDGWFEVGDDVHAVDCLISLPHLESISIAPDKDKKLPQKFRRGPSVYFDQVKVNGHMREVGDP